MRCVGCAGSGYVLGGGMIRSEHDLCKGTGKIVDEAQELMDRHPGLSRSQATSVIAEALEEINKPKVIIKRRKKSIQEPVLQVGA